MTWVMVGAVVVCLLSISWRWGARHRLDRSADQDVGERAQTAQEISRQIENGRSYIRR